ncbi:MAG: transferase [Flavobacteriales bacterium]|nr:transferase [Flavobacteriales bacterium]MBL0043459.1 transferase [Flavobacteriales bacterium]
MEILLIGSGSRVKSAIDVVHAAGEHRVTGIVDNTLKPGDTVFNVPAMGHLDDLQSILAKTSIRHVLLVITDIGMRMNAAQRISSLIPDLQFISAVHPSASIGRDVSIGTGTLVMAGAVIEAGSTIGEHVVIGAHVSIGADGHIGSFVSIGAGAVIAEACSVGSGTSIGILAGLTKGMIVGTHCAIGTGAMVLESVPDLHVAVGSPAKCVRTRLVGEPNF